ncbi:MAG: hypothetical protein M5R36_01425 [Deltaproteobacteria bacterium]|nr:hypothetical protein [Deltaproteobacteria bacterium]
MVFGAVTGCSCGNGLSSSSGQATDDDSGPGVDDDDTSSDDDHPDDDDANPDDDDDANPDDDSDDDADDDFDDDADVVGDDICVDVWDDVGECPRGFLTPDGACIERIAGGAPGREGVSIAVGPDNLAYVAAVKGRDLRIYTIDASGAAPSCTVRTIDFMAAGPSMVMDADGHFHLAYTNLWTDTLKYATDASGTWTFEDIADVGPERTFSDETLYHAHASVAVGPDGNPHIAYINRTDADLRYARKSSGTWTTEPVVTEGNFGAETGIAVDPFGHAHIVARSVLTFGAYMVYATNKTGTWTTMYPSGDADGPAVATDAAGNAHIAVWLEQGALHQLTYITDASGTWTSETPAAVFAGHDPAIVVDASGAAHIADLFHTIDGLGAGYFTNKSGTWKRVLALREDDDHSNILNFSLALDAAGEPRIAYYLHEEILSLRFASRENGTWTAEALDSGASIARGVWWGMDNAGSQHLLNPNFDFTYEYGFRASATDNWKYEEIMPEFTPAWSESASCKFDGTGIGHLVFGQGSGLAYATNSTGDWVGSELPNAPSGLFGGNIDYHESGVEVVSVIQYDTGLYVGTRESSEWVFEQVDPLAVSRASIKIDDFGAFHASYGRGDGVVYAMNGDGTWTFELIDETTVPTDEMALTLDPFNNVHLAYGDGVGIVYRTNNGGTWAITDICDEGDYVSLAVDNDGIPHVLIGLLDYKGIIHATPDSGTWKTTNIDNSGRMISSSIISDTKIIYAAYDGGDIEKYLISIPIGEIAIERSGP